MYTEVDYIIIGQGLAGSALAIELLKAGKRIVVIDQPSFNVSTNVAAGLFNPITGNKLAKTWLAEPLFSTLHEFYKDAESMTRKRFLFRMPLYRPFVSGEEQNEWMTKTADELKVSMIEHVSSKSAYAGVADDFGGLLVGHSGYVDTKIFMEAARELIRAQGVFMDARFVSSKLEIENDWVQYERFRAGKIIFCEGTGVVNNPWFGSLPLKALKGETLLIKCEWNEHVILNRGVYMVPSGQENRFKIGSTYNWNDKQPGVTDAARIQLEQKLSLLIRIPFQVERQEWGERPTTPDRRPILGVHPNFKRLVVFNGLGTKGVSLAPYFSRLLIQWMEKGQPLWKEIDVTRFKLLY